MKKFIAVSLIALMAMTSVFAGGSSESTTEDGVTTLTFAVWDYTQNVYLAKAIEAFEAANPDINIEVQDTPAADYITKLNTQLNGGSNVDMFLIKEADKTKTFYDRGQLASLSPYIEAAGIDMTAYNGTDANFTFDGQIYGMPLRTDQYVLFYNKDIFDAAGVPYPDNDMTWTEFEEIAAQITTGEGANRKYGAYFHSWNACVQNWGVQDGKHTIMSGDYEFFKPYYEMVLRMQDAGTCMSFAQIQASGLSYTDVFSQGLVGMLPMGSWLINTMVQRNLSGESDVNWGVAVIPHAEDVPNGYTVGATTPICINNASKNKDAAWKFVYFICAEEGAAIYNENIGLLPCVKTLLNDPDSYVHDPQKPWMATGSEVILSPDTLFYDTPTYMPSYNAILTSDIDGLVQEAMAGRITSQEMLDEWADIMTELYAEEG